MAFLNACAHNGHSLKSTSRSFTLIFLPGRSAFCKYFSTRWSGSIFFASRSLCKLNGSSDMRTSSICTCEIHASSVLNFTIIFSLPPLDTDDDDNDPKCSSKNSRLIDGANNVLLASPKKPAIEADNSGTFSCFACAPKTFGGTRLE